MTLAGSVPRRRVALVGAALAVFLAGAYALAVTNNWARSSEDASIGGASRSFTVVIEGVSVTARLEGGGICVSTKSDSSHGENCSKPGTASLELLSAFPGTGTVVVAGRAPSPEVQAVTFTGDGRAALATRRLGADNVFFGTLPKGGTWTVTGSGPAGRWVTHEWDVGSSSGIELYP